MCRLLSSNHPSSQGLVKETNVKCNLKNPFLTLFQVFLRFFHNFINHYIMKDKNRPRKNVLDQILSPDSVYLAKISLEKMFF